MPMSNLIEHSNNCLKTTGSLWSYYIDELKSGEGGDISYSIKGSISFDHEISITGRLEGNNTEKEVAIVLPLKHLSNFSRTLDMLLINCEINLILAWSENCAATSKATTDLDPDAALKITDRNCMFQWLLYQLKMIINFKSN